MDGVLWKDGGEWCVECDRCLDDDDDDDNEGVSLINSLDWLRNFRIKLFLSGEASLSLLAPSLPDPSDFFSAASSSSLTPIPLSSHSSMVSWTGSSSCRFSLENLEIITAGTDFRENEFFLISLSETEEEK